MKNFIGGLLLLTSLNLHGQQSIDKIKHELTGIKTVDQAENYLTLNRLKFEGEITEYDSKIDSSDFSKELLSRNVGDLLESQSDDPAEKYFFKVLQIKEIKSFRVQYIFLDNKKLTIHQIDSIRNIIFNRLKNGDSFDLLAKNYSMDPNAQKGGDLGWFEEGMMMKDFEDAVKDKKLGEVYKVDIASKKWYYVVKNSHRPRTDKKVTILYLKIKGGT